MLSLCFCSLIAYTLRIGESFLVVVSLVEKKNTPHQQTNRFYAFKSMRSASEGKSNFFIEISKQENRRIRA